MGNKITRLRKYPVSFVWTFFTRWQALAADGPTWLAIEFWERSTGKTMDPHIYLLLMVGVFAAVSFFVMWIKQRRFIEENMARIGIMRVFDSLIMRGYEAEQLETDAWRNDCIQHLEKLFGTSSYEVKVFKKEASDLTVTHIFQGQKAKFALMQGGKLMHPNALFRDDDGSLVMEMSALKWSGDRFAKNNPVANIYSITRFPYLPYQRNKTP